MQADSSIAHTANRRDAAIQVYYHPLGKHGYKVCTPPKAALAYRMVIIHLKCSALVNPSS